MLKRKVRHPQMRGGAGKRRCQSELAFAHQRALDAIVSLQEPTARAIALHLFIRDLQSTHLSAYVRAVHRTPCPVDPSQTMS